MSDFQRGDLNPEFREALKASPIFQELRQDPEIFIGIRDKYVDAYYKGNRIGSFKPRNGGAYGQIHYKYLLDPDLNDTQIEMDAEGRIVFPDQDFLIKEFALDKVKRSASRFASEEKDGIQKIFQSNPNIVDLEIAFRQSNDLKESQYFAGENIRVDIAAIVDNSDHAELSLYEVKHFLNPELRGGSKEAKTISQLGMYERRIYNEYQEIRQSYKNVLRDRLDLGLAPEEQKELFNSLVSGEKELSVRPYVPLVLFGFDDDQKKGNAWKNHILDFEKRDGEHSLQAKGDPNGLKLK